MADWPRMRKLLTPKRGERFAIVSDVVTGDTLLVDLERLYVVMSDSVYEKELNREVVEKAHGDILSLGFGLGILLQLFEPNPAVTSITIIELNQEVLDLVMSQLHLSPKTRVILANALDWIPDRQFDIIYDDCDITIEDMKAHDEVGISSDTKKRLSPWLNPGGEFIRWKNPSERGFYD
jgi:spermidine synthase